MKKRSTASHRSRNARHLGRARLPRWRRLPWCRTRRSPTTPSCAEVRLAVLHLPQPAGRDLQPVAHPAGKTGRGRGVPGRKAQRAATPYARPPCSSRAPRAASGSRARVPPRSPGRCSPRSSALVPSMMVSKLCRRGDLARAGSTAPTCRSSSDRWRCGGSAGRSSSRVSSSSSGTSNRCGQTSTARPPLRLGIGRTAADHGEEPLRRRASGCRRPPAAPSRPRPNTPEAPGRVPAGAAAADRGPSWGRNVMTCEKPCVRSANFRGCQTVISRSHPRSCSRSPSWNFEPRAPAGPAVSTSTPRPPGSRSGGTFARPPALTEEQRARLLARLSSRLDSEGRLRLVASESRSQLRNREDATERLRDLVASALAVRKPRKRTKPSRAAKAARLEAKRRRSALKRDRRRAGHDE